MKANCISGHATAACGKHAKCNNDTVITGRCIIIKTGKIMLQNAAQVGSELSQHDRIKCSASWNRTMLRIMK